jgi:Uri superfamily endonuclease
MRKRSSFNGIVKVSASIPDSGCYVLLLRLDKRVSLEVGALGEIRLPPGQYAYVGRARRNLRARVFRHIRGPNRVRWHIDYLRKVARIAAVGVTSSLAECAIAAEIAALPGARTIPRFGAGDCRCPGHLIAIATTLPFGKLGLTRVPAAAIERSMPPEG